MEGGSPFSCCGLALNGDPGAGASDSPMRAATPRIGQYRLAVLVEQHICGLEIPVHVPPRMQRRQALRDAIERGHELEPRTAAPGAEIAGRRVIEDREARICVNHALAAEHIVIPQASLQPCGVEESRA